MVCVVAILLWAGASLMDLGTEFGVAAFAGVFIAGNSGFFLGFVVFSLVFLALFVVLGSVVSKVGIAGAFVLGVIAGIFTIALMGPVFGPFFALCAFMATFLLIGAALNRMERRPAPVYPAPQKA